DDRAGAGGVRVLIALVAALAAVLIAALVGGLTVVRAVAGAGRVAAVAGVAVGAAAVAAAGLIGAVSHRRPGLVVDAGGPERGGVVPIADQLLIHHQVVGEGVAAGGDLGGVELAVRQFAAAEDARRLEAVLGRRDLDDVGFQVLPVDAGRHLVA